MLENQNVEIYIIELHIIEYHCRSSSTASTVEFVTNVLIALIIIAEYEDLISCFFFFSFDICFQALLFFLCSGLIIASGEGTIDNFSL